MQRVIIFGLGLVLLLFQHAFFAGAPGAAGNDAAAPIHVVDGDTLQIGAELYDIAGIDAPELGQVCLHAGVPYRCGVEAAEVLHKRIQFDRPACAKANGTKSAGGSLAAIDCVSGDMSLADVLLENGAVVVRPGAPAAPRRHEARARAASVGLWRGRFVAPRHWRDGERLAEEAEHAPACPVKAIIAAGGDRLFFVPTDQGYAGLKVDQGAGGRCFGSDEEALRAGWRRPQPPSPPNG